MNTKSTYSEKLKDPRWQKKRLEVMEYNDFCCEVCGDSKSTLHVHHNEYLKGREVWDYERDQLSVICDSCHEETHSKTDFLKYVCSFANLEGPGNSRDELAFLIAGYLGLEYEKVLSQSDWESCSFTLAPYACGINAAIEGKELLANHLDVFFKEKYGEENGKS